MAKLIRVAALGVILAAVLCGCPGGGPSASQLDPHVDHDGDGWARVDGDLDDTNPLVNPGACEILNNGIDDDCDTSTSDTGDPDCSTAAVFSGVTPRSSPRPWGCAGPRPPMPRCPSASGA